MVQMVQSVATIASTTVQEQVDNAHKTPLSPNGNNDGSFEGKDGKEQDDDDVEDDRKPAAVNDHEHEHDDNDNDSISSSHSSSSSSSGSGTSTSSTNTVNSSHGNQVDTEGHDGNGENNVDTNNNTTNKARDGLSDYERLREERIRRNQEYLATLGLDDAVAAAKRKKKTTTKNSATSTATVTGPRRHSLGRASKEKTTTYSDSVSLKELLGSGRRISATTGTASTAPSTTTTTAKATNNPNTKNKRPPIDQRVPWEVHAEFKRIGRYHRELVKKTQRQVKASFKQVVYYQKLLAKYQRQQQQQLNSITNNPTLRRQLKLEQERKELFGKTKLECLQELDKKKTQLWKVVVEYERQEKLALKSEQRKRQERQLRLKQEEFQIKMDYVDTWDILPKKYPHIYQRLAFQTFQRTPKDDPKPPRRSFRSTTTTEGDPTTHPGTTTTKTKETMVDPLDDASSPLAASLSSFAAAAPPPISQHPQWKRNIQAAYARQTIARNDEQEQPQDNQERLLRFSTTPIQQGGAWISPFLEKQLDREWMNHKNDPRQLVPQVGNLVLYYPGAHKKFLQYHPDTVGMTSGSRLRTPLWDRAAAAAAAASSPAVADTTNEQPAPSPLLTLNGPSLNKTDEVNTTVAVVDEIGAGPPDSTIITTTTVAPSAVTDTPQRDRSVQRNAAAVDDTADGGGGRRSSQTIPIPAVPSTVPVTRPTRVTRPESAQDEDTDTEGGLSSRRTTVSVLIGDASPTPADEKPAEPSTNVPITRHERSAPSSFPTMVALAEDTKQVDSTAAGDMEGHKRPTKSNDTDGSLTRGGRSAKATSQVGPALAVTKGHEYPEQSLPTDLSKPRRRNGHTFNHDEPSSVAPIRRQSIRRQNATTNSPPATRKRGRSLSTRMADGQTANEQSTPSTARRIAPRSSRFQGTFKVPTESVRDLFHGAAVTAKLGTKKEQMQRLAEMKKRSKSAPRLSNNRDSCRSKFSIRKLKKIIIKVSKKISIELPLPTEPKRPRALSRPRSLVDTIDPFPDDDSDDNDEVEPVPTTCFEEQPLEIDPDENSDRDQESWWTHEWLSGIDSDLGRYPILCRVEQTNAEFPQDAHRKKVDKNGNITWLIPSPATERTAKQYVRLCLKLQPLTPILPPCWDEVTGTMNDVSKLALPPTFSVVTFPSNDTSPFLAPFAGTFARSHSLSIGDAVQGTSQGKIAEFASLGRRYGNFRLENKIPAIQSLLLRLTDDSPSSVSECLRLDSPQTLPEVDAVFVVEFLSIFLESRASDEIMAASGSESEYDALSLLDLVRGCLPLFHGIGLRREAFHRKVSYASAWDLELRKPKKYGFPNRVAELIDQRLAHGIPSCLPKSLQGKIRYSIQHFLESRPEASGFAKMVTEDDAPNYFCAVPMPMFFDRILARLESGKKSGCCYYTSVESVLSDIQCILLNCRRYNSRESPLVTLCSSLVPVLMKQIALVALKHNQDCAKEAIQASGPDKSSSLDTNNCCSILRCFDVLKRRCLNGKEPDSCDDRYRLEAVMSGALPTGQAVGGLRSLPTFEELLVPNENVPLDENAMMTTRGVRKVEVDPAFSRLTESLYLPPWTIDTQQGERKLSQKSAFRDLPIFSTMCLELIRVRLKDGYYHQRDSIINDLEEAYITLVFHVLSGPASRKKKRISPRKITSRLCLVPPGPASNDDGELNGVDESNVSLTEEESQLLSRLKQAQKLYSMAILAVQETDHVERLFGFVTKPRHINTGPSEGDAETTELVVGNPEMKAAARRIRYLLAATGREPCENKFTNFGALKVTITVGEVKIRLKHKTTGTLLSSVPFSFDEFSANDDLAFALLKRPGRRAPCARCQIYSYPFFVCRVVRGHSNPDYDFVANWKECGGVNGLLAPFALNETQTDFLDSSRPIEPSAEETTANDPPPHTHGEEDRNENRDQKEDEVPAMDDPSKDLVKAQEMFQNAKRLESYAEELSKKPPRLGKRFIETTFPIDPSDGRYIWCTICGLSGDVLCCDGCANVVHSTCVGLFEVPEGDWFCDECSPINKDTQETHSLLSESNMTHAESSMRDDTAEIATGTSAVQPTFSGEELMEKIEALDKAIDDLIRKRLPSGEVSRKTRIRIGTAFYKSFPGIGRFKGTVRSLPADGTPYFHVEYEDGDSEDMEEDEIIRLVEDKEGLNMALNRKRGRPKKDPSQDQEDGSQSTAKGLRFTTETVVSPGRLSRGRSNEKVERNSVPTPHLNPVFSRASRIADRRAKDVSVAVMPGHRGWTDEENDLFFDGITKFKAKKKRDDRWERISNTINTKTKKQVLDQLYWFFHGSREAAHQAYLERKRRSKEAPAAAKHQEAVAPNPKRTRKRDLDETDAKDSHPPPRRGRPPKRGTSKSQKDDSDDENPKRAKRFKVEKIRGKWTDDENDLFFDGIEKFNATSTRNEAWDNVAQSIETRPNKQVMDHLNAYFKGYRDKAFQDFCERRGFLTVAPPPKHEDLSTESDDETPPPSEQKRRGRLNVFRINPSPVGRSRSMASAASSLSEEDWDAPSQRRRGRPRALASAGRRKREVLSETPTSSHATPSGRKARRCMRCLQFSGKDALACRGRKGRYGQAGCEFFTASGKPLDKKTKAPNSPATSAAPPPRKRARSESPAPGGVDTSTQRGDRAERRQTKATGPPSTTRSRRSRSEPRHRYR